MSLALLIVSFDDVDVSGLLVGWLCSVIKMFKVH